MTRAAMEKRGIRLVSPPKKPPTSTGTDYFTVEDFTYDSQGDEFICPAGARLHYAGRVKDRPDQRRYQASKAAQTMGFNPIKASSLKARHVKALFGLLLPSWSGSPVPGRSPAAPPAQRAIGEKVVKFSQPMEKKIIP